jgi:peptidyl-prolyl cis-trans isomerase A (cyclophilin A)
VIVLAGQAAPPPNPLAGVGLRTDAGDIILQLDQNRAPIATCNFLRYVQAGRYDGAAFFRTVVFGTNTSSSSPIDVVQAATAAGDDDPGFGPIPLERTRDTGLSHVTGAISMARDGPDTATSSFFIVIEDTGNLDFGGDRHPDGQGFAAFGRVFRGMDVVRDIHAGAAVDERLVSPVVIREVTVIHMPQECRS